MRRKPEPETDQQRDERLASETHSRGEAQAASDAAIDAMVKRSIKLYGA